MVDINPWGGDYTGTIVRNNRIFGGFASGTEPAGATKGVNIHDAIIK